MVLASHSPRIYTYAQFFLLGVTKRKFREKKLFFVKTMSKLQALTVYGENSQSWSRNFLQAGAGSRAGAGQKLTGSATLLIWQKAIKNTDLTTGSGLG
jgi:hypothetical protein